MIKAKRILHKNIRPIPPGSHYSSRGTRSEFIARHFASILSGRILDVGCFEKDLRAALPENTDYFGIDLYGKPDLIFDLESGPLPFDNKSFDVVICADVLEHLENMHRMFDELLRVSSKYVIISLPNCWHGNWRWMLPWNSLGSGKYYGLPVERPKDRHRWFFNTVEALQFLNARTIMYNAELVVQDFIISQRGPKRFISKVILRSNYLNWAASAIWAVIKIS